MRRCEIKIGTRPVGTGKDVVVHKEVVEKKSLGSAKVYATKKARELGIDAGVDIHVVKNWAIWCNPFYADDVGCFVTNKQSTAPSRGKYAFIQISWDASQMSLFEEEGGEKKW